MGDRYQEPVAVLRFNYNDVVSSDDANNTYINMKNVVAYRRINLRDIIGTEYDNFNLFNISLVNTSSSLGTGAVGGSGTGDRINMLYMSGFSWTNNYDSLRRCKSNQAFVGAITYVVGTGVSTPGVITDCLSTFAKADGTQDIILYLYRSSLATINTTTGAVPFDFQFTFNIYGIKDDELSCDDNPVQSNSFLNL